MGDFGNAASGGGSSSSSLDQLFSDASLGDAMTGGTGDLFGGGGGIGGGTGGGGDLATLFADAGLGSALLGDSSGLGGLFTTTDPSGTQASTQSMTPSADAAGTPAGSDPSANIGGTQSGGAPQPTQPQAKQEQPAAPQNQSPLASIAKALRSSFGLGDAPTAGGPTGLTKAAPPIEGLPPPGDPSTLIPPITRGKSFLGGIPGGLYDALRATPAETGELPYGGYAGAPNQPARPVTPTPAPQASGPMDPTIAAGGPGAGARQPPADPAKPDPAPAPAAPAAPAPATADVPTRKEPAASEAAPDPPQGVGGPTGGMGGIGELLRDVLGMTLASPVALPMLAQLLMGGRGPRRGGIPPWAMHGMMPFMRGTRRGFVGFRGGFLRPGYYPRRQGGWGFHPGGYHPGWGAWAPGVMGNQPMAFAGGGGASGGWQGANVQSGGIPNSDAGDAGSTDANGVASSSNPFISTLLGQESGGQNIVSRTDKDDAGRTLAQGGNPNQISQGYFQIRPSTWRTYAERAGVDPNILPRQASYADQWKVASIIPAGQWGPDTKALLERRFGAIDWRQPLGQVASRYGGTQVASSPATPSSSTRRQPGFQIRDPDNPSGLTSHAYPAPTETTGAPEPVQSDDFASAG